MSWPFVTANANEVALGVELRLHYLEWGPPEGRPLLLLHGITSNAQSWTPLARRLVPDFRVIALDQRGHGDSSHTSDYSLRCFAHDIRDFIDKLGLASVDLVGHSLGARNSIAFAGDHGNLLRNLVLVDFGPEQGRGGARKVMRHTSDRPAGFRSYEDALRWYRDEYPDRQVEFLEEAMKGALRRNYADRLVWKHDPELLWITGSFGVKEEQHLWDQWRKIQCRTLVVRGEHSDILTREIAARMVAENPRVKLQEIPGAHHGVPQEKPNEFAELLSNFLDEGS